MRRVAIVVIFISLPLLCVCTSLAEFVSSGAYVGNWIEHAEAIKDGKGSRSKPFKISKPEHLAYLAKEVNSGKTFKGRHFVLDENIDLAGKEWDTIGDVNISHRAKFSGNFNGSGKTISNLKIDKRSQSAQGLFGFVESAKIENVSLVGCMINGKSDVGGMAGCVCLGEVTNCRVEGIINGQENVGAIVGRVNSSNVIRCASNSKVSGILYSGGIVGNVARNSKINKCYSLGEVSGAGCVGGLVGLNDLSLVINSFSRADIVGRSSSRLYAGGLVGSNCGKLKNSFTTSQIICDAKSASKDEVVGLIAGYNKGVIKGVYYSTKVHNLSLLHAVGKGRDADKKRSDGKFELNESNIIKLMYSNKLFGAWGPDIWEQNPQKNEGYPFLKEVPMF